MTDRYDQDKILGYVEGELSDSERESFEIILGHDHELRNLVAQMKLDRDALRKLGRTPAPVGLIDHVIRTQERAALLGEPDVPEPLPLVPVNRYNLRRVLAYAGVAAVLLLSAAVVIPTLMPSGLLDHKSQLARNATESDRAAGVPDTGTGVAIADEDAAYDTNATRSPARSIDETKTLNKPLASAATTEPGRDEPGEPATKPAEIQALKAKQPPPVLADAGRAENAEKPEAPDATLARAERVDEPEAKTLAAETTVADAVTAERQPAEPVTQVAADTVSTGPALAKTEPQAPVIDPFGNYAAAVSPDNSQLLINATSPRKARRDLRNWALSNSVVIQEVTDTSTLIDQETRGVTTPVRTRAMAGDTPRPGTAGGTSGAGGQLVIEINESQVPALLAHLNRGPGQRAELVALSDGSVTTFAAEQDTDRAQRRRDNRQARETERTQDDAPKAVSNRMFELPSGLPNAGLATGLAPTQQPDPAQRRTQPVPESTPESAPEPAPEPDQSDAATASRHGSQPPAQPEPTAVPAPFDWGKLLDTVPTQPITPTPLLQPEPTQRLRLQVFIQQVADAPIAAPPEAQD